MKKIFTAIACTMNLLVAAQNVGINNTDPKAAIDINGGLRLRPLTSLVSGTSVTLLSNHGYHFINGTPTGNFTISFSPAPAEGQHTIITNTTSFTGNVFAIAIPSQTTVELFYSNGGWKQIGSNQPTANSWSLNGNAGTTESNFIGTTDAQPIRMRTHNNRFAALLDNERYNYHIGFGFNSTTSYTGARNITIGYAAANQFTTASNNIAMGDYAMSRNTEGSNNVALGTFALGSNIIGNINVAVGAYALYRDTSAGGTVAIGYKALYNNQNRYGNVAIGFYALQNNTRTTSTPIAETEGEENTAIGTLTLNNNVRGSGAVAIGYKAAFTDTSAHGMVAIGRAALFNNNGMQGNTAIGDSALYSNGVGVTTDLLATGNTAVGSKVLYKNTTGYYNTALGFWALRNNVTGDLNTAIGHISSIANISGVYNTSVGGNSLQTNRFSNFNVAIGNDALNLYNPTNEEDGNNVAIGVYSLHQHATGVHNVAVGRSALSFNYSGNKNTAIGSRAGERSYNSSGNVFIGYEAGTNTDHSNNKLYIENSNKDSLSALIYGDFLADSLLINAKTINKFSLNVRGNYPLEIGYGTAGKQVDAGKLCYGCFGDPAHWLGMVGGGTAALGGDRVIKLWSEGGLRIKGNALPDINNLYSLGTSDQRWKEVWTNAGAINTSDANLKTNIANSPYGLSEVMQMNPVQYNWKTNPDEDLQIGFLAQDIQKIIPEAVVVPANGDPLGMKYTELIPVLVKSIQEQQAVIDNQNKKLVLQQKQIEELFKILKKRK